VVQTDPTMDAYSETFTHDSMRNHKVYPLAHRHDPPEPAGASMADERFRPATEHGGHQPAVPTHIRATNRIHPLPEAIQATAGDPVFDRFGAEPERKELPA